MHDSALTVLTSMEDGENGKNSSLHRKIRAQTIKEYQFSNASSQYFKADGAYSDLRAKSKPISSEL